jgi:hypothetical protein
MSLVDAIAISDESELPATRAANPDKVITLELVDGRKLVFIPGRDRQPFPVPASGSWHTPTVRS